MIDNLEEDNCPSEDSHTVVVQVLRVFVNGVTAGQKGSSNIAIPDLEAKGFAQWDDTILNAIDQLMVRFIELIARGNF